MGKFIINSDAVVEEKFNSYPIAVKPKMKALRKLVLEAAAEIPDLGPLEETLKWGEPSYLAKKGSTLRMDWKAKAPDQYALYFKCTSKLVQTFRVVYGDSFNYEKNRAIVFGLKERLPKRKVKKCIKAALTYHSVKHKELLGLE